MNKKVMLGIVAGAINLYRADKKIQHQEWPFDVVAALAPNPRQRDTELRVDKPHLKKIELNTSCIVVAVLPDGTIHLVDGHSRILAMLLGKMPKIHTFNVMIFSVDSMKEVKRLYDLYDSNVNYKTGPDRLQGAMREIEMEKLSTNWLREGKMPEALKLACDCYTSAKKLPKIETLEGRIAEFSKEIIAFDKQSPIKKRFLTGTTTAFLMGLRKYGVDDHNTIDLLNRYNSDLGIKDASGPDGAFVINEIVKDDKKKRKSGGSAYKQDCGMVLSVIRRVHGNPDERFFRIVPENISKFLV